MHEHKAVRRNIDRVEIIRLAQELEVALLAEYNANSDAITAANRLDQIGLTVLSQAYADGTIAGKNADTRKREERLALAGCEAYKAELEKVTKLETRGALATITRKYHEAIISLTKAWLYSQSG